MALRGTLETMAFAEVIRFLCVAKRTGVLRVESEGRRRLVRIVSGEIHAVGSDPPYELVGPVLLARTDLSARELAEIFDIARRSNRPASELLTTLGRVSADCVRDALAAKAPGWAVEPSTWVTGTFEFSEGEDLPGGSMATTRLRWQDVALAVSDQGTRVAQLCGALPGPDAVFTARARASSSLLPAIDSIVLDLASAGLTRTQICLRANWTDLEVLESLARLLRDGLLGVGRLVQRANSGVQEAVSRSATLLTKNRACEALVLLSRVVDELSHEDAAAHLKPDLWTKADAEARATLGDLRLVPELSAPMRAADALLPQREQAIVWQVDGLRSCARIIELHPTGEPRILALAVLAGLLRAGRISLKPPVPEPVPLSRLVASVAHVDSPTEPVGIPHLRRKPPAHRQELEPTPGSRETRRLGS